MKRIAEILFIEDRDKYKRTHALIIDEFGNTEQAVAFGDGFAEGEEVEYFFDHKWNTIKFAKLGSQGGKPKS
jgi:hypothetical protein